MSYTLRGLIFDFADAVIFPRKLLRAKYISKTWNACENYLHEKPQFYILKTWTWNQFTGTNGKK